MNGGPTVSAGGGRPAKKRSPPMRDLPAWLRVPVNALVASGLALRTSSDSRARDIFDWDMWVQSQFHAHLWVPDGPWCNIVRDWAAQRPLNGLVARDNSSLSALTDAMVKLVVAGFMAKAYKKSDPATLDLHKRKHINVVASRQKEPAQNKVNLIDVVNLALAMFDFAEFHRISGPFSKVDNPPSHPIEIARREMQQIARLVSNEAAVRESPRLLLSAVQGLTLFLRNEIKNYHWIPWYVVLPMNPPVDPHYERIARDFCNGLPPLNVNWLFRDDNDPLETHPVALSNWMVCLLEASHVRRWSTLAKIVHSERVRTGKSISGEISHVIMKTLLTSIAKQYGKTDKPNLQDKIEKIASRHRDSASTGISFRNMLDFAEDILTVKRLITTKQSLEWNPELVTKISSNLCQIMGHFRPTANPCLPYQICWVMNLQRLSKEYALSEPTSPESFQSQVNAICSLFKDSICSNVMNPEAQSVFQRQANPPTPSSLVSPVASGSKKRPAELSPSDLRDIDLDSTDNNMADQDTSAIVECSTRVICARSSPLRQVPVTTEDVIMIDRPQMHVTTYNNGKGNGTLNSAVCRDPWSNACPLVRTFLPKEGNPELQEETRRLKKMCLTEEGVNGLREASRQGDVGALSVYGALLGDDNFAYGRVLARKRKNIQRAVRKLIAAVHNGNLNAVSNMFEVIYNAGLGPLPRNLLNSLLFALKVMALRSARSALVLAQLLYRGAPGLEPVPREAFGVYNFVLNDKNVKNFQRGVAHNNLGAIYLYCHPEVHVDTARAILHYQIAYICGNQYALTHMGNLYQYIGEFEMAAAFFHRHFFADYSHGMTYFTLSETCRTDGTTVKRTDYALRVTKTSCNKFVTSIRQTKVAKCLDYVDEVVSKQEYVVGVKDKTVLDLFGGWDATDVNAY